MSKVTMLDEIGLEVLTKYCRNLSLKEAKELKKSLENIIELNMESISVLNMIIPELQAEELKLK